MTATFGKLHRYLLEEHNTVTIGLARRMRSSRGTSVLSNVTVRLSSDASDLSATRPTSTGWDGEPGAQTRPEVPRAVITNPPSGWVVRESDKVFVLIHDPKALYASRAAAATSSSSTTTGDSHGTDDGLAASPAFAGAREATDDDKATEHDPPRSAGAIRVLGNEPPLSKGFVRPPASGVGTPSLGIDETAPTVSSAILSKLADLERTFGHQLARLRDEQTACESRLAALENTLDGLG